MKGLLLASGVRHTPPQRIFLTEPTASHATTNFALDAYSSSLVTAGDTRRLGTRGCAELYHQVRRVENVDSIAARRESSGSHEGRAKL